ncbi:MAG: hypothetical protein AAFR96_08390 [Planctomycetota bacterium]
MSSNPVVHAAGIACGAVVAGAAAGGVTASMGGPVAWPAVLVVVTAVACLLPALSGGRTVPSRYGAMVLFGMSGQMLLALGGALLVRVAADVPAKPFLAGVAAGVGVLLCVQVALSVRVLSRAVPAGSSAGMLAGEDGSDRDV